jgi:hypothetical protein
MIADDVHREEDAICKLAADPGRPRVARRVKGGKKS